MTRYVWLLMALLAAAACSSGGGDTDVGPGDAAEARDGQVPPEIDVQPDVPPDEVAVDAADAVEAADAEVLDGEIGDLPADETGGEVVIQGTWVQVPTPALGEHVLNSMWGFEDGNVLAVGEAGLVAALVKDTFAIAHQDPSLNILNGVWGSSSSDVWTVGMYGLLYHYDGLKWDVPRYCQTVEDCSFAGDCLLADCLESQCQYTPTGYPGCCGTQHFATGFDGADAGLLLQFADLYAGTMDGGIGWNVASVVAYDGQPRYVSAPSALYFGNPTKVCVFDGSKLCPDYNNGKKVGGTATSPDIVIPDTAEKATLSFNLFLDVEASPNADQFVVNVQHGGKLKPVWNKTVLSGAYQKKFIPIQVDLSSYVGKTIRVQFFFDSVTAQNNALEGIYIDDVVVETSCSMGAALGAKFPTLWSVWGADPANVFAVGNGGAVLHFDGTAWQQQAGGETYDLAAIHGVSADDMVVAGPGGFILHGKGAGWEKEDSGSSADFIRVGCTPAGWYMAVGAGGAASLYDGTGWKALATGVYTSLNGVAGFNKKDFYVVGASGKFFHYNGMLFMPVTIPFVQDLYGVWGDTEASLTIVGDKLVASGPPDALVQDTTPVNTNWRSVWGQGSFRAVCGKFGQVMFDDGSGWQKSDAGVEVTLGAIWGFSPDDVYAVGEEATLVHWDGTKWTKAVAPAGEATTYLDVWGPAPDNVFVVGQDETLGGFLVHWDGKKWGIALSASVGTLRHVHGTAANDVLAVGQYATIMHYDGNGWGFMPIDPIPQDDGSLYYVTQNLLGVFAMSPTDAWAVGELGTVVHYDGSAWTLMANDPSVTLRAVFGVAPDAVWAVGDTGVIWRWAGQGWTPEPSGSVATLRTAWGDKKGNIFAAGDKGTVLKYQISE